MDWAGFAREASLGVVHNIAMMAMIVIPIMLVLEVARDLKILDRIAQGMAPVVGVFRLSREAAFPLLVGIIFGIAYGAGVLIEEARSGRLSWKDLFLINVFLSVCHAVVEDTALFIAVGANGVVILLGRFIVAVLLTFLLSRSAWLEKESLKRGDPVLSR
ncbi:Nucleoside recognition [Desulfotomaculum arcticum]|uniref:Nucleoside recognition n=1 Tax=Desulfotruncus arcticus DSM 17038 TaxID=1121424 RepID=A0A1I2QIB1_9FIRM|nr:nucleoside recognition domain-containing protein [Desulfotruncus arcticus]SFG25466.1 Nucleoside recognition [Desulfotomaculum arcticum] [Desulfotruncus arcticus DSM 17038]